MPSGILWNIIARDNLSPKFTSWTLPIKVAIPSGKLWRSKAIILKMPNLYNESLLSFISLLIINTDKLPNIKDKKIVIKALDILYSNNIVNKDDGIKSVILMPIIIAIEKDRQKVINLFILLLSILKKIIIPPNKVDIPAKVDIKKAFNVFKIIT